MWFWSLGQEDPLEEGMQPTLVFLPEECMDRGVWWAIVHRVSKSRTRLKWLSMHAAILERGKCRVLWRNREEATDLEFTWGGDDGLSLCTRLKSQSVLKCTRETNKIFPSPTSLTQSVPKRLLQNGIEPNSAMRTHTCYKGTFYIEAINPRWFAWSVSQRCKSLGTHEVCGWSECLFSRGNEWMDLSLLPRLQCF